MTIALSTRTRVILAFVVPCTVFVVMIVIALGNSYPPDVSGDLTFAALIVSPLAGLVWLVPEYLACVLKRPFGALASLIAPPSLTIVLILVYEEFLTPMGIDAWRVIPYGPWIHLVALAAGLALLRRVFRRYAIPLSLAYIPPMWLILLVVGYWVGIGYEGR